MSEKIKHGVAWLIRKHVEIYGVMPKAVYCAPDMWDQTLRELADIPLDDRPQLVLDFNLPPNVINMPRPTEAA